MERRKGCDARAAAEIGVGSPMDVVAVCADAGVSVDGDVGREEESEGVEGGEGVTVFPAAPLILPLTASQHGTADLRHVSVAGCGRSQDSQQR